MKNGECRRKLTSAGCVFYVNRDFSGLNGKRQMVMNCPHKGAAALLIAPDKCKWIYIHLTQNCVWRAANAVYCGNRGETEGGRHTEVQVCQFTSVTVYTNVSVMTHCFIISGTKTTTVVTQRPNNELLHGSIKTVLHTKQNSATFYKCCYN